MMGRWTWTFLLLLLTACGGGGGGGGSAAPPPSGDSVPPEYAAVAAAAELDDGSPLLSSPVVVPAPGGLRTLVVLPTGDVVYPDLRRIQIHLDGFGLQPEYVADSLLAGKPLADYSALVLVNSAWESIQLDAAALAAIVTAVENGLDLLWLGSAPPPELESLFGVRVADAPARGGDLGITAVQFTGGDGSPVSMPFWPEEIFSRVDLAGADLLATFEPGGLPAATFHRAGAGFGRAVLIPFYLHLFWGQEEAQPFTWARPELLTTALCLLLSRGAVLLSPFPDGYPSALFLRLEDISPGGTLFSRGTADWLDRFQRLRNDLAAWRVPLQIGVTARYVDPAMNEDFGWLDPDPRRQQLREALRQALESGSELIAHGWTHQCGEGLTGDGYEFSCEDASGSRVFLSADEQRPRIEAARRDLTEAFGVSPAVWETPHLEGNQDTYRLAAEAGFAYANESDANLFPNRWGLEDRFDGHLLNLPQAGSFVPNENPQRFRAVNLEYVLPRLVRLRAPFLFFYHGFADDQLDAARALVEAGVECGLWFPTLSEFGTWWTQRETVSITAERVGTDRIRVLVDTPVPGTTLRVRLPDGKRPVSVRTGGDLLPFTGERQRGVAFASIVLSPGAGPVQVDILYE